VLDEQPRLNEPPAFGIVFGRGLHLLGESESGRQAVFFGTVALFEWAEDDRATRRLVIAQLVNAKLATRVEVAHVFGLHVNTVSRIAQHVAAEGVTASVARKRGPRGPFKVTPAVVAELRQAVAAALTERAAQRQLEQHLKIRLSQPQVHRVMSRLKQELAEQPALALLPVAANEDARAAVTVASVPEPGAPSSQEESTQLEQPWVEFAALTLAPGQCVPSRYLGLMLFYPALQVVGLLELAAQVYHLAGMVRFGVQQVFTELFCLAVLQEPSVERLKHVLRSDLGAVMGSGQAACVKTLRRKLDELSRQRQAVHLGTLLARHWLEVGLVHANYLYVDGHVKVYNGTRLVPEVWNSHRRMPLPGIVQYFVNDLRGRPLLVVTEEVRGNLAKSLPRVIAAIRQVVGTQRFTVIFDRGGFDGQLFTWLVEQGLDFITYQRGEVHLGDQQFARREVRWEGQRVRFSIAEDAVSVGESGPWRRIVIRTPGHQRPILTSLDKGVIAAGRVAALMLTRWRQENFFKYARGHLGLDVLTTYAAETVADHEVPNPTVKAATAELKRLRATAQKLRAALGRALVLDIDRSIGVGDHSAETADQPTPTANGSRTRRSSRVPPTTRAALITPLQTLEVQLEETKSQLRNLPARVPLSTLGPLPQTPQLETKLIADAVKVAAYNAQSWLADRLARHYLNTNDLHDLLRSFAHLSGTLSRQADGGLKVCLQPPDIPLHRRALAGLCADLNLGRPVFPGTDILLHYEVADRRHDNDWSPA
jgi:prepilin-type processing-associated H-X9-DG protein